MCFFFEADAAELALKAGREARQLYRAEHGLQVGPVLRSTRSSLREKLEDTLLLIPKLVDPIKIKKVVRRLEDKVYTHHYSKKRWMRLNEAKFLCERFLVLNVIVFYGCLKYLLASIS